MEKLFIPILVGTNRQSRRSINVAKLIKKIGDEIDGIETEIVDPDDYDFKNDGNDTENKNEKYSSLTLIADAFLIVVPEYNHSFPASLKAMLDSELKNYIHKPVAFAGVSSGSWGGVRAIESLVNVVRELGLVSTFTDVNFPSVKKLFDDEGKLLDDAYLNRVKRCFTELIWMAKTLKWGRENVESRYH